MSEPSQPTPPPPPVPPVPPTPRYGEYAPEGYVPPRPAPGYEQVAYGQAPVAGARRRRTWDTVLTVILLVMGLFGSFFGVLYGFAFSQPALISQVLQQQGYPAFNGDPGAGSTVLIVSHVVLYLIAAGGGIALLLTKRIAFWVPLVCGMIAAIFFWGALFAIIASDPTFVSGINS